MATTMVVLLPPLDGESSVNWWEITRIAIDSVLANKVRAILTMLGVMIGVASVVALLALGSGATTTVTEEITSMGTNLLAVVPGSPTNQGPGRTITALTLSRGDAKAIQALNLPVLGVAPQLTVKTQVVAPSADKNATVIGTSVNYATLSNLPLGKGTWFTEDDVRSTAYVIVLGNTLASDLFGSGEAVGQTVRVRDQNFRVIGVLKAKGGSAFGSVDEIAYIPITVAYQRFPNARTADGNDYVCSFIGISVKDKGDIDAVKSRIQLLVRERHYLKADGSEDDFNVLDQTSSLSTLTTITTVLTTFLAAIAGISLLVGGIGIMNIMLVSVTERTREIGLRKAVGARSQDILLQFIVEALALSITGGLIGLAIGSGLALLVNLTGILKASISLVAVVAALGFSVAVGAFFGIYPAQRAARLNPIDALRHD